MLIVHDSPILSDNGIFIIPIGPGKAPRAVSTDHYYIYSKNDTLYFYNDCHEKHFTFLELVKYVEDRLTDSVRKSLMLLNTRFYSDTVKAYIDMPFISIHKKDEYQLALNFILYSPVAFEFSPYKKSFDVVEDMDDYSMVKLIAMFMEHIDVRNDAPYVMIFSKPVAELNDTSFNLHCCAVEDIGRIVIISSDADNAYLIHAGNYDSAKINALTTKDVLLYGALVYTDKDLSDIAAFCKGRNIYYHTATIICRSDTLTTN